MLNPERDKKIIELWSRGGLYASEIGTQLGCSKGAVLGVVRRARLRDGNVPFKYNTAAQPISLAELDLVDVPRRETDKPKMVAMAAIERFFAPAPSAPTTRYETLGDALLALRKASCRYAMEDEQGHWFCGEPTSLDIYRGRYGQKLRSAYCAHHRAICTSTSHYSGVAAMNTGAMRTSHRV